MKATRFFLFVIVLIFLKSYVWAFEYSIESEKLTRPSITDSLYISATLKKFGYDNIYEANLTPQGLPFDRAYVSPDWNKSILLKAGLRAPDHLMGKIITESTLNILVFHFKHQDTSYMMIAMNIPKEELIEITKPWRTD